MEWSSQESFTRIACFGPDNVIRRAQGVDAMAPFTHRSDPDLFLDARRALDERPSVPAGVRVHVDHGTVTLTGSVRWPRERSEAESVVREVDGVLRIVNNITVVHGANPEGFEAPDDTR
jgi:osmotically-inducible protein OsmY